MLQGPNTRAQAKRQPGRCCPPQAVHHTLGVGSLKLDQHRRREQNPPGQGTQPAPEQDRGPGRPTRHPRLLPRTAAKSGKSPSNPPSPDCASNRGLPHRGALRHQALGSRPCTVTRGKSHSAPTAEPGWTRGQAHQGRWRPPSRCLPAHTRCVLLGGGGKDGQGSCRPQGGIWGRAPAGSSKEPYGEGPYGMVRPYVLDQRQ